MPTWAVTSRRDPDSYLQRIGWTGPVTHDLETLAGLQLAHLQTVPFEALDVFAGRPVQANDDWAWDKIVHRTRGGWCFEANGAFGLLLELLGFEVRRLGAAVLLGGPAVEIDHLVLEVMLDQPYLVEAGFGDRSPITPIPLNSTDAIETIAGTFEFINSPQGTTLTQHRDGVPEARYRFKRVNHSLSDFQPASDRLSGDRSLHWSTSPYATRLLDAEHRLTLTRDAIKQTRHDGTQVQRSEVPAGEWNAVLADQFGIEAGIDPAGLARRAPADAGPD